MSPSWRLYVTKLAVLFHCMLNQLIIYHSATNWIPFFNGYSIIEKFSTVHVSSVHDDLILGIFVLFHGLERRTINAVALCLGIRFGLVMQTLNECAWYVVSVVGVRQTVMEMRLQSPRSFTN